MKMEKMKKLLITTDCFLPRWDGIARFLNEIIPQLKKDYKITVIAPEFEGEFKPIDSVDVHRFPLIKMSFGDIYFSGLHTSKIKKIMEDNDIVFNQTIGPIGISSICAAKKLKKPIIAYTHSIEWELATKSIGKFKHIINIFVRKLTKYYYNKYDIIIFPAQEVLEKFRKNGITSRAKIVHMGTDVDKFAPAENKDDAKKKINIDPKFKVIGYVGRLAREKDPLTLYRAFRKLEKKHDDIKLLIIGEGLDEYHKKFSSERNIIYAGKQDNVVPYLQAMDIFVLPSLTETSSLSTIEAMSCGLPVITTPVGYIKEYIKEKLNGMFFPFRNSLVLSMKIETLLKNPELRIKLGVNARRTVKKLFSWDKTADGIKEVLGMF